MAEKGNIAEIKSVGEPLVYETPWLVFYHDDIEHPVGSPGTYAWVKGHSGNDAVMTIPVTSSERYLLIRVYRHLSKRNLWEFPAGLIENCEPPLEAARRELIEETGIKPDSVELLGSQVPVAGFAGDVFHLTLAVIPEIEIRDVKLQAEEGMVDHIRLVLGAVLPHVHHVEALRQIEVELDRGALPRSADGVAHLDVHLGAVESTISWI